MCQVRTLNAMQVAASEMGAATRAMHGMLALEAKRQKTEGGAAEWSAEYLSNEYGKFAGTGFSEFADGAEGMLAGVEAHTAHVSSTMQTLFGEHTQMVRPGGARGSHNATPSSAAHNGPAPAGRGGDAADRAADDLGWGCHSRG